MPRQERLSHSLASVFLDAFATRLAFDFAAPVELTAALPPTRIQTRVITSPAAHRVTAVSCRRTVRRARHGPVAAAAAGTQRHGSRVQVTVARRRVEVDEAATNGLLVGGQRPTR